MSYCRFSCLDFQCDVYTYADVSGGYTTHIAGNRAIFDRDALPPEVDIREDMDGFIERHNALMEALTTCDRQPIDLPYAGESFNDETARECADRLISLREIGYTVPQYAIDTLLEEDNQP